MLLLNNKHDPGYRSYGKEGPCMKRLLLLLKGVVLLCLLISCGQGNKPLAEQGLQAAQRQVPDLNEFEAIAREQRTVQDADYAHCYYSTLNIAFGTTLPEAEALDRYTDALLSLGWKYDEEPEKISRLLKGGSGRYISVKNYSGTVFLGNTEYAEAKDDYPTVIFVRLEYFPPCN
jgi:hypothetical protein